MLELKIKRMKMKVNKMTRRLFAWCVSVCVACGCLATSASAQGPAQFRPWLDTLERHSPHLAALRSRMEAQQEEARRVNVLEDPEVEFEYLWGDPSSVGSTKVLGISQTFDFPTTYVHRRRAARQEQQNATSRYMEARRQLLLRGEQLCITLVSLNASLSLEERAMECHEVLLADALRSREEGAVTQPEYNSIETATLLARAALSRTRTQRAAALDELSALCGGMSITLADTAFSDLILLPSGDFETWSRQMADRSPLLREASGEVARAESEVKVARSGWWPKWSVGYVSEYEKEETKRGFSVGLSLPLWGNRGNVRVRRAELAAAQHEAADLRLEFMSHLRSLYGEAQVEAQTVEQLRALILRQNTERMLSVAYAEGHISRQDYLEGLITHYDLCRQLIEAEASLRQRLAELYSVVNF